MTNQEINEAVARKLGNDLRVYNKVDVYKKQPNGNYILTQIPAYCTSISAAWEIVLSVKGRIELHRRYDKWKCWLRDEIEAGQADTAPMAICLAFLKLEDTK